MGKIIKVSNLRKTLNYLKKNGIRQAVYAIRERVGEELLEDYHYEGPGREELVRQREEGGIFGIRFSILVPA